MTQMMRRNNCIVFTIILVLVIVLVATACNRQTGSAAATEENTDDTHNGVSQNAMISKNKRSQAYSFQEFSKAIGDEHAVSLLFSQFGEAEAHSFRSSEYGETHYYIYPLADHEYCFVFFDPQPYTGTGDIILELMQYPSERFEQYGSQMVREDDILACQGDE